MSGRGPTTLDGVVEIIVMMAFLCTILAIGAVGLAVFVWLGYDVAIERNNHDQK
jgi:hypothetical protein